MAVSKGKGMRKSNETSSEPARTSTVRDYVPEMDWFHEHWRELAEKYPGEWLAIDGFELVGHSDSMDVLIAQATAMGHPDPFITAISLEPVTVLFPSFFNINR